MYKLFPLLSLIYFLYEITNNFVNHKLVFNKIHLLFVAVTGAAQIIGDLVTGRTVESATGFSAAALGEDSTDGPTSEFLAEILHWRAVNRPDDALFSQVDARVSTNYF